MQLQSIWVDRGETQDKVGHDDPSDCFRIGVVSRSASLGLTRMLLSSSNRLSNIN